MVEVSQKNYDNVVKSAEKGEIKGMGDLACFYALGTKYNKPDEKKALDLFEKAIKGGYKEIRLMYAEFLLNTKKNKDVAMALLKDLSEEGDKYAKTHLARIYIRSDFATDTHYKKAFALLSEAEDEVLEAEVLLAKCYIFGLGVEQDVRKGEDLLDSIFIETRNREAITTLYSWHIKKHELLEDDNDLMLACLYGKLLELFDYADSAVAGEMEDMKSKLSEDEILEVEKAFTEYFMEIKKYDMQHPS